MSDKQSPDSNSVTVSIKTGLDGNLILEGTMPVSLPEHVGSGFAKAVKFAAASLFPNCYKRGSNILLKEELKKSLCEALLKNIECDNKEEAEYLGNILVQLLTEQDVKNKRRISVIEDVSRHIGDFITEDDKPKEDIVSDDFLYHFWNVADKMPEDELRKTYSRILAKEIASPNSISASTLHLLTTLHPDLAKKFELFCSMTFSYPKLDFVIIGMPGHRSPATSYNSVSSSRIKGEQLSDFGLTREDLLELRSAGLIRSMPEEEYPKLEEFFNLPYVDFAGKQVRLEISVNASTEKGFSVTDGTDVVSLTRSGSEVRRILCLEPHKGYADRLIKKVMVNAAVKLNYL